MYNTVVPTYDLLCEFESSGRKVDLLVFLRHRVVHVDLEGRREGGLQEGGYVLVLGRQRHSVVHVDR